MLSQPVVDVCIQFVTIIVWLPSPIEWFSREKFENFAFCALLRLAFGLLNLVVCLNNDNNHSAHKSLHLPRHLRRPPDRPPPLRSTITQFDLATTVKFGFLGSLLSLRCSLHQLMMDYRIK